MTTMTIRERTINRCLLVSSTAKRKDRNDVEHSNSTVTVTREVMDNKSEKGYGKGAERVEKTIGKVSSSRTHSFFLSFPLQSTDGALLSALFVRVSAS
jgi:hypothetical protein